MNKAPKLVVAAVALVIVACSSDGMRDMRRMLLRQSMEFCTSQLQLRFNSETRATFRAGLDGTAVFGETSLREFWEGALLDADFLECLRKTGISANDFQDRVSKCQHEELQRSGYYDMIQGTAGGYQYGYQWGYQWSR